MPGFDGTGPFGTGPLGRGRGGCFCEDFAGSGSGRGMRGRFRGGGQGRGRDMAAAQDDEVTDIARQISVLQTRLDALKGRTTKE